MCFCIAYHYHYIKQQIKQEKEQEKEEVKPKIYKKVDKVSILDENLWLLLQ